jgi:O-succinylbenzoic acid--CoA ligase
MADVSSLRPVTGTAEEILALLRGWEAEADPEPLVIATSGSTGAPKRVVLSRAAMRASALATQERLGGPGQWVLNLPPSYVAGVQVLYRSVLAGTDPVVVRDDEPLGSARRRMTSRRTYLSLVPTQLVRALGDATATRDLGLFTKVLIGGGPLDPQVRRRAEDSGIAIVQTYGMSETCGGCVYDGVPLDGLELRFEDRHVLLRGPMLFDGYEGEPERTASVVVDGWLRTEDLGVLEHGRLRIEGRADDVIISGGVKVPASAVAARLEEHPSVREAAVVGVPDEEWGQLVTAFVVAPSAVREEELRALFHEPGWAPKRYRHVEALPLLPNGKLDRVRLRLLG